MSEYLPLHAALYLEERAEDEAVGSRDFGRGYMHAVRVLREKPRDDRVQRMWTAHGVGHAIHLLMEAGVPPEQHEALHEYIDYYEISVGNTKREPRSTKYKATRENT